MDNLPIISIYCCYWEYLCHKYKTKELILQLQSKTCINPFNPVDLQKSLASLGCVGMCAFCTFNATRSPSFVCVRILKTAGFEFTGKAVCDICPH